MTAKTLEQEAYEAADRLLMENAPVWKYLFSPTKDVFNLVATAYILAATARDKEIEELRNKLKAAQCIIDDLHSEEKKNEREIEELRARVKELEAALVKASKLFPVVPPIPLPEGDRGERRG